MSSAQMRERGLTLPFWMIYDDKEGEVPPVKATNVSMVETEKYVEAGLWHTADTLAELAEKIGVPAANLEGHRRAVQRDGPQPASTPISGGVTRPTTGPSPAANRRW